MANQYSRNWERHHEAAAIGTGAGGELAGTLCISTSWLLVPFTFSMPFGVPLGTPLVVFSSVLTSLFCSAFPLVPSLFSFTLPLVDASADSPSGLASSGTGLGGAFHLLIPQVMPVKLLSWKVPLVHFRHGFPDRSRARKPALIAPWLAFGPSLCDAPPRGPVPVSSSLEKNPC